jgi:hypothetical protein
MIIFHLISLSKRVCIRDVLSSYFGSETGFPYWYLSWISSVSSSEYRHSTWNDAMAVSTHRISMFANFKTKLPFDSVQSWNILTLVNKRLSDRYSRRIKSTRCYSVIYWTCESNTPHPGRLASNHAPELRQSATKVLYATCCNHQYSLELLMMGIIVPETCLADHKFKKKSLNSILLVFFSSNNDDARTSAHHTDRQTDTVQLLRLYNFDRRRGKP